MYRPYLKTISRLKLSPRLQSRLDGSDLVQETALRAQRSIRNFQGDTEEEFTTSLRQDHGQRRCHRRTIPRGTTT